MFRKSKLRDLLVSNAFRTFFWLIISVHISTANPGDASRVKVSVNSKPAASDSSSNAKWLNQSKKNWEELKRDREKMKKRKSEKKPDKNANKDAPKQNQKAIESAEAEVKKRNQIEIDKLRLKIKKRQLEIDSKTPKNTTNAVHE